MDDSLASAEVWTHVIRLFKIGVVVTNCMDVRNIVTNPKFTPNLISLVKSSHTFLAVEVVNFLKALITVEKEDFKNFIIKSNLMAPIVDAFVKNYRVENAFKSSVRALFEAVMNLSNRVSVPIVAFY